MSFVKGVTEDVVPDIKLTRSRDGQSGTATFAFASPSVFEASSDVGDITGLYMDDEEGTIMTVEVQAKFINGKPSAVRTTRSTSSSIDGSSHPSIPIDGRRSHSVLPGNEGISLPYILCGPC